MYFQTDDNRESESLSIENTLWANTVVASGTALGVVIYTGRESRSVMNTSQPKSKVSNIFSLMLFQSSGGVSRYSKTSIAQTSFGPWKFIWDMGSLSNRGLIMAPDQEANVDNLGKSFWFLYTKIYVVCTHKNCHDEAILMSARNIQFHEIKKILKYLFSGAIGRISLQKRVRIIQMSHPGWSHRSFTVNICLISP